jgi:hypothetical protein
MKRFVFGLGVGGNVFMLLVNLGLGVLAFVKGTSLLGSAAGVAVNALVAYGLIAIRDYTTKLCRRLDAEGEMAEHACNALRRAGELHVTVGEMEERRH